MDFYNYHCMEWASQGYAVYISRSGFDGEEIQELRKQKKIVVVHGKAMREVDKELLKASECHGSQ